MDPACEPSLDWHLDQLLTDGQWVGDEGRSWQADTHLNPAIRQDAQNPVPATGVAPVWHGSLDATPGPLCLLAFVSEPDRKVITGWTQVDHEAALELTRRLARHAVTSGLLTREELLGE